MGRKLLSKFHADIQKVIRRENLLFPGERVLCAVSGGVDSMALAQVLKDLGFGLVLAHVNFGLRGLESNEDEAWIRAWAEKENIPLEIKKISADFWQNGVNIQVAAREIRYAWFDELRKAHGIQKLATAHHADDQLETIIAHFFRGTGLPGLRGILPENKGVIRPFLGRTKKEITEFAREFVKEWRTDSSNATDHYQRNQIRHHLVPVLESIFPGFEKVVARNATRARIWEMELENRLHELDNQFGLSSAGGSKSWDWFKIQNSPSGRFFLAEILHQFKFPFDILEEIWETNLQNESKVWNAAETCLEIKNGILRASPPDSKILTSIEISNGDGGEIYTPTGERLQWGRKEAPSKIEVGINQCWISPRHLQWPLRFRSWQPGDKLKPFGMKGRTKKVSDILTEAKLNRHEKANTLILENGDGQIIWIPGVRSSEIFKLNDGEIWGYLMNWQKKTG